MNSVVISKTSCGGVTPECPQNPDAKALSQGCQGLIDPYIDYPGATRTALGDHCGYAAVFAFKSLS